MGWGGGDKTEKGGTRRSEREKRVLTVAQWSFPASALYRKLGDEVVSKSLWGKASVNPHTTSTINGAFNGLRIKPHIREHPWRLHGALPCNNTVWSHTYVPALHRLKATECLLLLSLFLTQSLSYTLSQCVWSWEVCIQWLYLGLGGFGSCVSQPELGITTQRWRAKRSHMQMHILCMQRTHTYTHNSDKNWSANYHVVSIRKPGPHKAICHRIVKIFAIFLYKVHFVNA